MRHLSEEQLILYHYGETVEKTLVETHLSSCASCRANLEALRRVLAAVDSVPVPLRSESYGSEVWRRLSPRLRQRQDSAWNFLFRPPRWAVAGAAAALVLAAFLLGRFWPQPERQIAQPVPVPAQIRERVLLASVGDHLERCQIVLMEVMNASSNGRVDIAPQQASADELVAANRLYRQTAQRAGEVGMASVLEDLERFLLEIARSDLTTAELDEVRQRIEVQGVLFKVRVMGAQVRGREQEAARELARKTL